MTDVIPVSNKLVKERFKQLFGIEDVCYVYVARADTCRDLNLAKIGASHDPKKRISGYYFESWPVDLIQKWRCRDQTIAEHIEHNAHNMLWLRRSSGDWFKVAVAEAIKAVEDSIEMLGYAGVVAA